MPDRIAEFTFEAARVAPLIRRMTPSDAEAVDWLLGCMGRAYAAGRIDGIEDLDIDAAVAKAFPNGVVMSR